MNPNQPMKEPRLNFHLSRQEKLDIANAVNSQLNQQIFKKCE